SSPVAGSAGCPDGPGLVRTCMLAVTVPYRSLRRVLLAWRVRARRERGVPQVNERRAGRDGAAVSRRARRLAWALLGVTVALLAAGPVIGLTGGEPWSAEFGFVPVAVAFAVVGAPVAANAYAARPATASLPGAAWVGWAFTVLLGITGSLFFLTLLLFPDGRPPSRRWWFVVWVAAAGGVAEMVTSAVSDVNFSSNFPKLTDPVTLVAPLNEAYNLETSVQVFILLAGAVSLVVRFRRSGPVERQQLKWFMYTAAVSAPVIFVVSNLVANPLPVFEIFFPLIPAAVGVAILKYRLYDIDRIISRTLAYAI